MDGHDIIRIDSIKWWMTKLTNGGRLPVPLCPEHDLRLTAIKPRVYNSTRRGYIDGYSEDAVSLKCAEGPHEISIPRIFSDEQQYVIDRVDAKVFKGMKILNLDDEATPIAKDKIKSKDGKYFVTSQLMDSKRGLQAVIYAGEKGSPAKTQIFISPEEKRLAFDHKDLHPTDVFLKIEATFDDGSKHSIEK
jgi:hypothetical protein